METDNEVTVPARAMEETLHPVQILAWQRMGHEEKWSLARRLNLLLREAAQTRIRRAFPDLSEEQVNHEVSRSILFSRT